MNFVVPFCRRYFSTVNLSSSLYPNYRIHRRPSSRLPLNSNMYKYTLPIPYPTITSPRYVFSADVLRYFTTERDFRDPKKETVKEFTRRKLPIVSEDEIEVEVITDYVIFIQEQAAALYDESFELEEYSDTGEIPPRMKEVTEEYSDYITLIPDLSKAQGLAKVLPKYCTPTELTVIHNKIMEYEKDKILHFSPNRTSDDESGEEEDEIVSFDGGKILQTIYENISLKNHKEKCFSRTGILQPPSLSTDLRKTLLHQINTYIAKPSTLLDYHPGSNNRVQDIVHPSLYPYVHGLSIVEPHTDPKLSTVYLPKPQKDTNAPIWRREKEYDRWGRDLHYSQTYQWLPSEFYVDKEGKVTINSYINNLPTEETDLYQSIAKAFEYVLPSLEQSYSYILQVPFHNEHVGNSTDSDTYFKIIKKNTGLLRNRTLQVITKIVRITLPPYQENTKDNHHELLGSWHAEGMSNEHIVATASITLAKDPAFTATIHFKRPYTLNEGAYLGYSMPQNPISTVDEFLNNEYVPLGKIQIKENDIIVFPNSHIHRIDMVNSNNNNNANNEDYIDDTEAEYERLQNKLSLNKTNTEPVERTLLVFWLIDPENEILSTKHVKEQYKYNPNFTLEKAFTHRFALMTERTRVKQEYNQNPLNLCEH